MITQTGFFRVKAWDEQTGDQPGGPRLIRVRAVMVYQGVIDGEGVVEFDLYSPDGAVTRFVGLEQVACKIGGRSGTAVFEHNGTFSAGVARSKWVVVPGSGTEGLRELRGEGCYGEDNVDAAHGGQAPLSFTFAFESQD